MAPAGRKECSKCGRKLALSEFHNHIRYPDGLDTRCKYCHMEYQQSFPYDSYIKVHAISPQEQYMVDKLATRPSLAVALDNMYRRDPKRWHTILVAATLKRREAHASA